MCASKPEFSTEVVEARMIDCAAGCSAARVGRPSRTKNNSKSNFRNFMTSPKHKSVVAHGDADPDQNEAKPERQPQLALTRLQNDRGRHNSRVARDIAADDQDCADFGDRAPKAGQH